MKRLVFCLFILASFPCFAQLNSSSKIYLEFNETDKEVNVNGQDALRMLADYVKNKTTLEIVSKQESSDYILNLSVYEKNMGNRMGKIEIVDFKTNDVIFASKWKKGSMNAFYGYSGTRHAIGRVFNGGLLKEFPSIAK